MVIAPRLDPILLIPIPPGAYFRLLHFVGSILRPPSGGRRSLEGAIARCNVMFRYMSRTLMPPEPELV